MGTRPVRRASKWSRWTKPIGRREGSEFAIFDESRKYIAKAEGARVNFEKYDMPEMDENGISTADGAKAAWFKDTKEISWR